jgi:peptide/nickel transport system substrate-binding protein
MYKRLVGIAASAAVIVAACGGATSSSAPPASVGATTAPVATPAASPSVATSGVDLFGTAYAPADGKDAGTIIIGDWQEATQFNPFYVGQVSEQNVQSAVGASLVLNTYDYKYAADLATEVPTTANGGVVVPGTNGDAMTVTWKLRDGLKWSDGKPLTCDDFRYAWEWVLTPGNAGVITEPYKIIKDWECVSDTEMVLHYTEISEGYISGTTIPLPRHYLESIPIADQVAGNGFRPEQLPTMPVSGAFKYQSVTPGSELRLVKNPEYTSWKTGKPAHLDNLIFKWYTDADAMIAGYKGGEVDLATDLQDSDLVKVQDLGNQVSAIPAFTYEHLNLNWSDKEDDATKTGGCSHNAAVSPSVRGPGCPMADAAFRSALTYAINKDEINTRVLGGSVQIANTNVTPNAWFYADQPPATFDPAKANQILDDAGWKLNADGIREKDGLKAIIELCTTTRQVRQDTLALIANYLKAVGIQGIPNAVAPADIFADYNTSTRDTACVLARSNYDLAEFAYSSSLDPAGNYFLYHSSQFEPDGQNYPRVNDPEVDKSLETVKGSVDFDAVKEAMATFQKIYVDKTVELPLYYRKNVELVGPALGNFFANPTQYGPTWNAVDWFKQN